MQSSQQVNRDSHEDTDRDVSPAQSECITLESKYTVGLVTEASWKVKADVANPLCILIYWELDFRRYVVIGTKLEP